MKSMCVCNSAYKGRKALTTNFRKLRKVFGLAIAAIGLSASIASAATITVINGNFETEYGSNADKTTNWVKHNVWSLENTSIGLKPISGNFSSSPDGGSNFTRFTWNDAGAEQNLSTNVSAGDTLSVTFNLGISLGAWDQNGARVKGNAYFKVGSTYYRMPFDLTGQTAGVWYPFTFTTTINNSGALSLGFINFNANNTYYTSLDGVSDVTLTPAANDPNAPSSANATLTVDEDTVSALTTNNFGYSDPNTNTLAAVQITALPTLGALKLSGTPVTNNEIVAVAAINAGNLTYLAATNANGSSYTTIGIKVMNASNLWSLAAVMTVNVTAVNDVPTSTGGSVSMKANTVKTFAAANFQFSDVDTGNTLQVIKVTTLPANGTLKLGETSVALDAVIPVASIPTLTYTPGTDYSGSDSFDFKVSDGTAYSAVVATMAITITVNQVPTSTGSSVITRVNIVKTFAVANFPFADGDVGDTLQAIKVTSLPSGTLTLNGTPITSAPSDDIPVASITNLTYTPNTDYVGADSFKYQVRDAALFSADATMAITVTSDIMVQNGSFETHGTQGISTYWWSIGSPWTTPYAGPYPQYMELNTVVGWEFSSVPDGTYVANLDIGYISYTQDLLTTVNEGDTLSVTFSGGRNKTGAGGKFTATFLVGSTPYTSSECDTSLLAKDSWQSYTFTTRITNTGNLSLKFTPVTNGAWLDKVSNVSVIPAPPKGTVIILY